MFLAIKIVLTIILVGALAFCTWFIIDEIITHKNWLRVAIASAGIILAAIDIWIMWGM